MITLSQVKKSFFNNHVLKNISFTIKTGEKVSIIGPGGCGKTLILKHILGLLPPDQGRISVLGKDMLTLSDEAKTDLMKKVGVAFQQGGLFDFMTTQENLFFAMENMTSFSREEMTRRSKELLDAVKLGRTAPLLPSELSGGMQRRVGIARALCTDPVLAFFDEPTSGLDPVTSTIILNMISRLGTKDAKTTLVVATSNVEIAIRFSERVIIVNEGEIVADGSWKELLVNGSEWVQYFLGIRFIGLDLSYAKELHLPEEFISKHWS